MPRFSQRSKNNLKEAHPLLQELFNEVIKHYDCVVIEGHRTKAEQDSLYRKGRTKAKYPHSLHNRIPSYAVDVVPYPIDWNDYWQLYHFSGFVVGLATAMGINIRCGADWDKDNDVRDQRFNDLNHFELIGEG